MVQLNLLMLIKQNKHYQKKNSKKNIQLYGKIFKMVNINLMKMVI